MSERECRIFMYGAAAGSLGLAGIFALQGFWVPLPFAILELLLLAACFSWVRRRAEIQEVIELRRDGLLVLRKHGQEEETRHKFNPVWVRLAKKIGRTKYDLPRMMLSAAGRTVEVGSFLNGHERERLFAELKRRLQEKDVWIRWVQSQKDDT